MKVGKRLKYSGVSDNCASWLVVKKQKTNKQKKKKKTKKLKTKQKKGANVFLKSLGDALKIINQYQGLGRVIA